MDIQGTDPEALFAEWDGVVAWSSTVSEEGEPFAVHDLGAPVPRSAQVFAIGVNDREHAAEAGYSADSVPVTFTKFPMSIVGADHVAERRSPKRLIREDEVLTSEIEGVGTRVTRFRAATG